MEHRGIMTAAASCVTSFKIAGRDIGANKPAFIVAEVAQAHDGSLGMAHAFIDAAAEAGADAVKFQTHFAAEESTLDEPFRVRFSDQDRTRFDYWRRMEFSPQQWRALAAHARERGLIFLSSAFSLTAVDLLQEIGVPAWKVGSGEFGSADLWEAMMATGLPILFSTGMASRAEIDKAVTQFRTRAVPYALLQCTSAYPSPLEEIGLNVIDEFREEYHCPVGLSDHSGSLFPGLAALARGADIVEVHAVFDRRMFGPDVRASLTFDELRTLCAMRDAIATMDAHPVDKDVMAERLGPLRTIFGRSLAPTRPLPAGTVLAPDMLKPKKPGGGIPPEALEQLIGRRLARAVSPNHILLWSDIEDQSASSGL
jgi:N,N'-diacetyllegionaminate synthase